jgi:hypothetical protein
MEEGGAQECLNRQLAYRTGIGRIRGPGIWTRRRAALLANQPNKFDGKSRLHASVQRIYRDDGGSFFQGRAVP